MKIGRNQKCPCGSGLKYKKCCGAKFERRPITALAPVPNYAPIPAPPEEPHDGKNWLMKMDARSKLDLDLLLKAAQDEELCTLKKGEEIYVDWEMLRPLMPFGPASHAAERFLPVLNGMMGVRFPVFCGLKLQSILGTAENGQWIPISWTTVRIPGVDQCEQAMEYLQNGGPTIGALYRLAATNAAVAEALLYFGRGNEPFFDLYKAFEVVCDTVGSEERLQELGLAARADCERFRRSANDPRVSGIFARHSQRHADPVADPMDEHQAREFVRSLLEAWTNRLLAEADEQTTTPA